jgi:uncharacterized MnhB-related membrane protein
LEIFIQIIGFIGIGMSLLAVQFNTHLKIMVFKSASSFLFCLQYFLMGAFTGMVMDVIGTIRNIVFAYNVRKGRSNTLWIIIFSILTAIIGISTIILTWQTLVDRIGWISPDNTVCFIVAVAVSIISIVAKLLTTVAYAFKDAHKIRMTNLPSCSCWIIYNTVVFSLAGITNEVMCIISIIIAEIRFCKKKPRTTEHQENI